LDTGHSDVLVHMVQGAVRRVRADMRECHASQPDQAAQPGAAPNHAGSAHDSELCRQLRYVLRLALGRSRSLPEAIAAVHGAHMAANQTLNTYLLPDWAANITEYHDWTDDEKDKPDPGRVMGPLDPEIPPPLTPGNYAFR
jgi:hypothetical protein